MTLSTEKPYSKVGLSIRTTPKEFAEGGSEEGDMFAHDMPIAPQTTLNPITELPFNLRKGSLNLPSQRKALALYKAPVVRERYKRVISHFKKPKNSINGTKLEPMVKSGSDQVNYEGQFLLAESKEGMTELTEEDTIFSKEKRKPLDLMSQTSPTHMMSEQDQTERLAQGNTTFAESPRVGMVNLGNRASPKNNEKLKIYFETKGKQEKQWNDLLQKQLKKPGETVKEKSFRQSHQSPLVETARNSNQTQHKTQPIVEEAM